MSAELITETTYNVTPNLSGKMVKFEFVAADSSDWVVFDDPIGACYAVLPTGAQNTCAYAEILVNDADTWLATDTTLTYDTVTDATELPATDGYIMMGTEIIHYTAGGASTGTDLTGCSRGCFGTTAAAHADSLTGYILNTLVFANGTTGLCRGIADIIGE
jgi:hypothetical protein